MTTSQDQGGQPPQIEADPQLSAQYLSQRLLTQVQETADTWAALQGMHREKQQIMAAYIEIDQQRQSLEEELTQQRAEVQRLRAEVAHLQAAASDDPEPVTPRR